MDWSFECAAISHIGNHRKNHEDNFYIGGFLSADEQSLMTQTGTKAVIKNCVCDSSTNRLFAISDGMGGHKHGEVASRIVVENLHEFCCRRATKASRKRQDKFAYIQVFQGMIQQTNANILDYAADNGANDNMGATLTGLIIFSDEAAPFNIGDSSAFLFENGFLKKLTVDDNELSIFEGSDSKKLEANGKRLTKYFGLPKSSGVLTATISDPTPLKEGQIYLLSSDGLTDSLSFDSINKTLEEYSGNIAKAANILVETSLTVDGGGRDNITVVAIKVNKCRKANK